ncbi:GDSL esterase/lipase At3g26430-like [Pistacia vera]|uniref:GDSL esterase/lipase At3g26430-like n=1 Tax=Pistacia vera TaxID=55513 RepID=UPI0012638BF5|nr:GDSL esterase/lipase At3g26430-like [Pistacia vera]
MEPRYCKPVIILTLLISVATTTTGLKACNFPAIFNFGDSNSDTGGLSAAFGQAPSPNGETYFHTPAGRFSDGRLVIDFIAEGLRLPHLSAFLDSVGSNFSHGANFATAGSTIRPQNTTISQIGYSPISLDVQSVQYSDFHRRSSLLSRQGGVFAELVPKEDYFAQALYTFDIGQNDITSGYKLNMTTDQVKAYIPDVLHQFSIAIKNVYNQGGRSFWIHNTAPLGCLPYVLDRFLVTAAQIDKYGCATPFNQVAQFFNTKLKETVIQLRKGLPLAAITYVDVYSIKYVLITQAQKLGNQPSTLEKLQEIDNDSYLPTPSNLREDAITKVLGLAKGGHMKGLRKCVTLIQLSIIAQRDNITFTNLGISFLNPLSSFPIIAMEISLLKYVCF